MNVAEIDSSIVQQDEHPVVETHRNSIEIDPVGFLTARNTPQPDELPAVSEDITVSTARASEVVEAEEEPPMVVELPKFEPMTEQPSQRVVSETLPPGLSTRDMYYQNIVGRGGGV